MLHWFKKSDPTDVLHKKYQKLMEEAFKLSTVNRAASDRKTAEADAVMQQILQLKHNQEV